METKICCASFIITSLKTKVHQEPFIIKCAHTFPVWTACIQHLMKSTSSP